MQTVLELHVGGSNPEAKRRTLREEADRVLEEHLVDEFGAVAAAAHFEGGLRHGERIAHAPVAGGVEPDAIVAGGLQHIDGARRRGFGIGIKRDAGPETAVEDVAHGVFLDVVDDHAAGFHAFVGEQEIHDEPRALELVLEVRGVDEDRQVAVEGELDVFLEDRELALRVLVQADQALAWLQPRVASTPRDAEARYTLARLWHERAADTLLLSVGFRRPDWEALPETATGSLFLIALVTCASLMPVDALPEATWRVALGLGFVSAVFDNIPLTEIVEPQLTSVSVNMRLNIKALIADLLARRFNFDLPGARSAGYSDGEVIAQLDRRRLKHRMSLPTAGSLD